MTNQILEHNDYQSVLKTTDDNEYLVSELKNYCKEQTCDTFIVSLSGGVDSMVIATIIKYIGHNLVCIHINYNNREESTQEAEFLKQWTEENGIPLIYENITTMKRGEINRKVYEEETQKIRFELYRNVLKKYENSSIILGHHDDDIIESVFMNVCKGRSILDLTVMKKECEKLGVRISRPLLGTRKSKIYEFAHKYNVPYFKDTTPLWSMRGKFRNDINPNLEKAYSGFSNNLLSISEQSDQWFLMVTTHIIEPFMKTIVYKDNSVKLDIEKHKKSPECFWRHVLQTIFLKYEKRVPTRKSIRGFLNSLEKNGNYVLTKNCTCCIENSKLVLFFN
tara:strand:+ start:356 stop:1363 length:1008 start_codon:yes stop_codon:yes gene_type:complete